METQNWLLKCKDLGYISDEIYQTRDAICIEIIKMLNALIPKQRKKGLREEQAAYTTEGIPDLKTNIPMP